MPRSRKIIRFQRYRYTLMHSSPRILHNMEGSIREVAPRAVAIAAAGKDKTLRKSRDGLVCCVSSRSAAHKYAYRSLVCTYTRDRSSCGSNAASDGRRSMLISFPCSAITTLIADVLRASRAFQRARARFPSRD